MANPFAKVSPGQRLSISAAWYNAVTDLLLQSGLLEGGVGPSSVASFAGRLIVRVKNTGSVEIDRFKACCITGSLFEPATQSIEQPLVNLMTLTCLGAGETTERVPQIALALETIQPGKIGRASLIGTCPAIISVGNALHDSCDVTPGTEELVSTFGGPIPILYKESGTGTKTAIVLLGGRVGITVRAGKVTAAPSGETAIESCTYSIQPTGLGSGALMTSVTPWRPTNFPAGTLLTPAAVGSDALLIDFPIATGGVTTRVLLSELVGAEVCTPPA